MDINDRIKELIRLLASNKQNVLAEATGISTGTLSGILGSRKSDPSFSTLMKIINAYPTLNIQWLLYGTGNILIDWKEELPADKEKELNNENSEIAERVFLIVKRLSPDMLSFANNLGYSNSQIVDDIITAKSAPTIDFIKRFMLSDYSKIISINWLLTGRGKMIIDAESENNLEPLENPADSAMLTMIRKVVADNALLEKKVEEITKKKR